MMPRLILDPSVVFSFSYSSVVFENAQQCLRGEVTYRRSSVAAAAAQGSGDVGSVDSSSTTHTVQTSPGSNNTLFTSLMVFTDPEES